MHTNPVKESVKVVIGSLHSKSPIIRVGLSIGSINESTICINTKVQFQLK